MKTIEKMRRQCKDHSLERPLPMRGFPISVWKIDAKKLMIGLFCLLAATGLHAEVSDDVWKALINQNVVIEKSDGTEVTGKLANVAEQVVVAIKTDGKVVSIAKTDVQSVRVNTASESNGEPGQTVADVPLSPMYFECDPFGFLGLGPEVEFGFRVTPSTLLGMAVRFEGLGLLYQGIVTNGFQERASLLSMGVEGMAYELLPARGMNRWYVQGLWGYGWGSRSGLNGGWQNNNSHLEVAAGGGYRWRFSSSFFLDLGGLAGAAIELTDSSAPPVIYLGALQIHLGWEF